MYEHKSLIIWGNKISHPLTGTLFITMFGIPRNKLQSIKLPEIESTKPNELEHVVFKGFGEYTAPYHL